MNDLTDPNPDAAHPQASDEKLQTFIGALDQSCVIVRTWDGVIQHWTAGCERLYGWTACQAVGQICQQLLKTKFAVPQEQIQAQLAATGSWAGELEHTRVDGTRLTISALWVVMRDAGNEPHLVIETQTDITAQVKMRRELETAHQQLTQIRNELERSNEELEEFARIASHDLSVPITSTRWLLDIFQERYTAQLDGEAQRCVDQISRSLAHMAELVEGVLAHARVGRESISSETTSDAGKAFASALDNLRSEIENTGADISSGPLPEVAAAPQALAQLFQNLLSNALKYRRQDIRPCITVSANQQDGMWLFAVRDNGIGIEAEWHERVFLPLQRVGSVSVSGSGIGLATCGKIVRRAGGRIWVESQPGTGSTFFFTLPASAVSLATANSSNGFMNL